MWLAQDASTPSLIAQWAQYGVLGLVVLGFLWGWLWAKPAVDRIIRENESLRARLDRCEADRTQELRDLHREVQRLREQAARDP